MLLGSGQQTVSKVADVAGVDELTRDPCTSDAGHRILERIRPHVLDDHGGDGVARRKSVAERLYGLAVCSFESAAGGGLPLALIEPESQELPDDPARSVGMERDRGEVPGLG